MVHTGQRNVERICIACQICIQLLKIVVKKDREIL